MCILYCMSVGFFFFVCVFVPFFFPAMPVWMCYVLLEIADTANTTNAVIVFAVVVAVVFYLSFDCYRLRHSFDGFVCVCVCVNVFSIYSINYIIDYILWVICANENFVLQLRYVARTHTYVHTSIYIYIFDFISLSHVGM